MFGLYPPAMLHRYVTEVCGVSEGTYYGHQKYLPAPDTTGPGGKLYFTEEQVKEHLAYWQERYKRYEHRNKRAK